MKYKNNKMISVYLMFGLILLVIGFSYAFFIYNKTGLYTHTITGGKMKVIYDETTGNNITIENAYPLTDEEALTKSLEFEFTITGYNESDKNVYYAIEIDHGEDVYGKNRLKDTDMKLTLYENDELIFENEIFENLDNQDIYYNYFSYGTDADNPIINNYKMNIWINDNVYISDTIENDISLWDENDINWIIELYGSLEAAENAALNACGYNDTCYLSDLGISVYTSDEFANSYANFKVNVRANLKANDMGMLFYDANGGEFTPKPTSLATNRVTMQKPVMEDKGFLGWSTQPNSDEVEYKAGEYYAGKAQVLYAVYSDTRNVIENIPDIVKDIGNSISKIKFINEKQFIIDEICEEMDDVLDLTYNNQGNVKCWIEEDPDNNNMNILYIASEGTTYILDGYRLFYGFNDVQEIDMSNLDTSMVTDMEEMFFLGTMMSSCSGNLPHNFSLQELDITMLNTSKVLSMSGIFSGLSAINYLDLSNFNTSQVKDMSNMFSYCGSLEKLNVNTFDTNQVIDMSGMFLECNSLNELLLNKLNTSSVLDMSNMFSNCENLTELDLKNFNTNKVENMSGMFGGCISLTTLDLSTFDTIKVEDMSGMFNWCTGLTKLNLNNFNTSNVRNMSNMFYWCDNLESLNLSNFDTSNVEDMSGMFSMCTSCKKLELSSFDTSNVTDMSWMFSMIYSNTSALIELDLTNFDVSNVTNTSFMFSNCSNLKTIYANINWNNGNITSSYDMFDGCYNLVGNISYSSSKDTVNYANPDTGYFTRRV